MEIKPISIPRNVIQEIPPTVVRNMPPPVVTELPVPVIEVPEVVIDYPTIDVPTQQEFEGQLAPPQPPIPQPGIPTRDLPDVPSINVPGLGPVDAPPVAPLVTAGATAVVVTSVTLASTILLNALKDKILGPLLDRLKKKKVKIKQKKPVLHFIQEENGVRIMEYSVKGIRLLDTTENIEQYLRDQVDIDSLYEYDNKLIIDAGIKDMMTKDAQKRFKNHFVAPKAIVKKLSAKFSL